MGKIIPVTLEPTETKKHIHPADIIVDIKPRNLEGLKVVFINLPLREEAVPNNAPEGILLMATRLRQEYGVEATIIDLNYRIKDALATERGLTNGRYPTQQESFALIKRHFQVYGIPDVIGLSGMITTLGAYGGKDVAKQQETARMVRELAPQALLVSGNGLSTELKVGLFNFIPELDAVAHSEGDDVIIKICYDGATIKHYGWDSAVAQGKLRPYYLGQIARRHRLIYAGDRPRSEEKGVLPNLPFADLSLIETDAFGRPVRKNYMSTPEWGSSANNSSATAWRDDQVTPKFNAVTSRGCPHDCDYCFRGSQGERLWGVRRPEHLYQEAIHNIEKYGIVYIGHPDDNMAVNVKRLEAMVPLYKELVEKGIRWGTHTRMDEAADARRIKAMADAGCNYIGFGAESAHPETLKRLNKGGQTLNLGMETIKVASKLWGVPRAMTVATRNCINYGIHANSTWIAGNPGETLERLKYSVAFMLWTEKLYELHNIPASAVNKRMFALQWYPGTNLDKDPKVRKELSRVFRLNFDQGKVVCDDAFYRYVLQLEDATDVMFGPDGEPLNFSDMPNDQYLKVRELIDTGRTLDILNM